MFLLIFRYVFGGAIETGRVAYADWLIPALAAGTGLFASGAVGVADDIESGLYDRLRSLPDPTVDHAARPVAGRHGARRVGRADAPSCSGSPPASASTVACSAALAAFGLCVLFGAAFSWPIIYIGLVAGSPAGRPGHVVHDLPVRVRVERLRAGRVDARLVAAGRRAPAVHR